MRSTTLAKWILPVLIMAVGCQKKGQEPQPSSGAVVPSSGAVAPQAPKPREKRDYSARSTVHPRASELKYLKANEYKILPSKETGVAAIQLPDGKVAAAFWGDLQVVNCSNTRPCVTIPGTDMALELTPKLAARLPVASMYGEGRGHHPIRKGPTGPKVEEDEEN